MRMHTTNWQTHGTIDWNWTKQNSVWWKVTIPRQQLDFFAEIQKKKETISKTVSSPSRNLTRLRSNWFKVIQRWYGRMARTLSNFRLPFCPRTSKDVRKEKRLHRLFRRRHWPSPDSAGPKADRDRAGALRGRKTKRTDGDRDEPTIVDDRLATRAPVGTKNDATGADAKTKLGLADERPCDVTTGQRTPNVSTGGKYRVRPRWKR